MRTPDEHGWPHGGGRITSGRCACTESLVERDIPYCSGGGAEQTLDLYRPASWHGQTTPAVLYVHGGAWHQGDKARAAHAVATRELLRRGYAVIAANYRLMPRSPFPAQIEDVKCAIRFARARAPQLKLDPDRIGAWGSSAGGHLVALLGTADARAGLEGAGGWSEQSSRVQAVVDMFGPVDLGGYPMAFPDRHVRAQACPLTYVSARSAPFLILHGEEDRVVPVRQSRTLHDRLLAAGASSTLVVVEHAGHNLRAIHGVPHPSAPEVARLIAEFFDRTLGT